MAEVGRASNRSLGQRTPAAYAVGFAAHGYSVIELLFVSVLVAVVAGIAAPQFRVCWRLDRLGHNLRHLVTLLEDLQAVSVSFVSLGEGIDCTTPAGKLQLHILAALAGFERERIRERVLAGLQRARAQGRRLGRPIARPSVRAAAQQVAGLSVPVAPERLGVSRSTLKRWRRQARRPACLQQLPPR